MDIYERCKKLAGTLDYKFILKGRSLTYDEVFSDTGMLPGIIERANDHCVLSFGYGIGVQIVKDGETMLSKRMVVDEKAPMVISLLFIVDVLMELAASNTKKGSVVLDDLLVDS